MTGFAIREALLPKDREPLLAAIRDYLDWLDTDLSHRGLDAEMAAFDARFTLPSGLFFLAEAEGHVAGCAGFLRHPGNVAEVKRLFVRAPYRGHRLGEALMLAVIDRTREIGVSRLVLDVVPRTGFATALYERMGFSERGAFYDGAVPGTRFFELVL
jgi:carbonic anhydrase